MSAAIKLAILDRDGTINADRDDYIKSPDEWEPMPGALEAIARLNHAGWHVVVATNQSGLGRGLYDMATFNAIHAKMNHALAQVGGRVDAVFFCPHTPEDGCRCRKPAPGLFEQIADRFGISLAGVPAIGDTVRDMQAAAAVKCETHLVLTGKSAGLAGEVLARTVGGVPGTLAHADLATAAEFIVQRERRVRAAARGVPDTPDSGAGGLAR